MSYDYSKLLGRIKEKCGTQAIFAEKIGISENSLSKRLNGKRQFRQNEILLACKALDIADADVARYFFTN